MPTYQYACVDCGEELEAVQKFSDDPLTECPNCGGKLRKVFSAVGVVFKGSGFYRNDSRSASTGGSSNGSKSSGTTEKASTSKSESSDNGSSTSKDSSSSSSSSGSSTSSSGSSSTKTDAA